MIDGCGCDTVVLSSELLVRNVDSIRRSRTVMDLLRRHHLRYICGHRSHLIERAYPVGRRVLMQDWEPEYLALGEALDPARLKADAAAQTRRFREIVDNWR